MTARPRNEEARTRRLCGAGPESPCPRTDVLVGATFLLGGWG
jgi:hypothetical protein